MKHDRSGAYLAQLVEAVTVELFDQILVEARDERFVEGLNGNHDVLHPGCSIFLFNDLESVMSLLNAEILAPARWEATELMTAVIKPVLRTRSAMEIDDDFESRLPRPVNRAVQVRAGTGGVWLADIQERPVPYGDPDDVEARSFDLRKVRKIDEVLPVRRQCIKAALFPQFLTQRPFIPNSGVTSAVSLEYRRSDEPDGS